MNKAMLCTVKRDKEEKNILIIKNKIDTEAHNLKIDYQKKDTDPDIQHLINSQVGESLKLEFLEEEGKEKEKWKLSSKKMFISDFDYAYDLSSLNDFINSLIKFKINDKEIDTEIIELLKNDIFSAADFWENGNIDEDLTAELILKYWDLNPVDSYPENNFYKKLLQFADGEIKIIDEEIAEYWFDIPAAVRNKIKGLVEEDKIRFKNYLTYLQTRDNNILNNLLLNFIEGAAGESQESINNLFKKFHYQLVDELTKKSLEKDQKINLNQIIPHDDSSRSDLDLKPELDIKDYSLLEVFNHYTIEIDFTTLNLLSDNSFESLTDYLKRLASYIDYLNEARKKLKCNACGQMMAYDLDYSQKIAAYKVGSARCNNLECEKFDQEINLSL